VAGEKRKTATDRDPNDLAFFDKRLIELPSPPF